MKIILISVLKKKETIKCKNINLSKLIQIRIDQQIDKEIDKMLS